MRHQPDIHFQVPSIKEGQHYWARLDRREAKYEIDLGHKRVSGNLSATELRALVCLLENCQRLVPNERFKNASGTMSDLRRAFAELVADGEERERVALRERMKSWISGQGGSHIINVPAFLGKARPDRRIDRLFRAFGVGAVRQTPERPFDDAPADPSAAELSPSDPRRPQGLEPPRWIRCVSPESLAPVIIMFAAERAFVNKAGVRQILRPGELPTTAEWKTTVDDLSGDTVAVGILSSHLSEYQRRSKPMSPTAALAELEGKFADGHSRFPLFFIGSAYANPFLQRLEEREATNNHYGARFDRKAPLAEHGLRVTFVSRSSECHWLEKHHMDRSRDIAVIRRWRTNEGADAMMAAGMAAQGTLGAVRFLCDEHCVEQLFKLPFAH